MLEEIRKRAALWLLAPFIKKSRGGRTRMYAAARATRLSGEPTLNSSADSELVTSLRDLRGRSRQLVRDASFARRAKLLVMNNVIGTGVGMQSQVKGVRGELNKPVNDSIETVFAAWSRADSCHIGGTLALEDFERAACGEWFEAGEAFIRFHFRPVGLSEIPLTLELIEAERIADEVQPGPAAPKNQVRMGVEVDEFHRPVAYWIKPQHPSEFRLGQAFAEQRYERVPADQIIHIKVTERWPQTRGVPWMHTVIRKLQDIDGYSEAEIVAARGAASYMASLETPDDPGSPAAGVIGEPGGERQIELAPGLVLHLGPGEKLNFHAPNRPNSAMDPFMRAMLREVAAGIGSSYASLSMDYSQSNYSSSRLALLDDRDLWRAMQKSFIRQFRERLHYVFLQQAVLARKLSGVPIEAFANDMDRYCAAKFKPRGWSWIDPTSEVEAYIKAVRAGFTDIGDVISKTADGRDLEEVLEARSAELKLMGEYNLEFDTDPKRQEDGNPIGQTAEQQTEVQKESAKAKAEQAKANAAQKPKPGEDAGGAGSTEKALRTLGEQFVEVVRAQKPPQALVTVTPRA